MTENIRSFLQTIQVYVNTDAQYSVSWLSPQISYLLTFLTTFPHILNCTPFLNTRVGTLIVATIYLQLIQNRYMFRSFTVIQCSHQHCVKPVASDLEVVGYL